MTHAPAARGTHPPVPRASSPWRRRATAVAAALAGALALAGCSGDGSDGTDDPASPTPSATASADSGGTGDSGAGATPADELDGSWLTTAGGKAVVLMVNGEQAALFATGGTMCTGSARGDGGSRSISLTCDDGTEDRAEGTVGSVEGNSLKVTWKGALGTETYTKAEGGTLPTGLPTPDPAS
ncbi:hypothetical protein ACFUV2_06305 [Streptomyces pilosus]|uniref:hypothetical protein n=1 Tax=Streptomyces pilosus TaxID=28893 RepID=UPI0036303EDE